MNLKIVLFFIKKIILCTKKLQNLTTSLIPLVLKNNNYPLIFTNSVMNVVGSKVT